MTKIEEVAIVVPAYNEEKTIDSIVTRCQRYGLVIVVDDGSADRTVDIVLNKRGTTLIRHGVNRGYDEAIKSGVQYALENGFKYCVTIDADGQHPVENIPGFLDRLAMCDVVVAERDKKQRISEALFGLVGRALWVTSDPLSGMKGYSLDFLRMMPTCWVRKGHVVGTSYLIYVAAKKGKIDRESIVTLDRVDASRFGVSLIGEMKVIWGLLNALMLYYQIKLCRT